VVTERLTCTIPEFARLAGISTGQAYALANANKLGVPILKFGKRIVLPRQAVEQLLRGSDTKVTPLQSQR